MIILITKKYNMPSKKASKIYVKKTHYEHIIDVPDTYIGGIDIIESDEYIYDHDSKKMQLKNISYSPGFIRIIEEIILNAFDQTVRDDTGCNRIKINIDKETGRFTIFNNGQGIPVEKHEEYKVWIPSMIFGELLTSSNYDKNEKRITGGKNGYGAKLTNIFSKEFIVETIDSNNKKKFIQKFENNKLISNDPIIKRSTAKSYVQVSFIPDYKRFNMKGLTNDIINYFYKRAIDLSICSNKDVSIYFNDEKINIKTLDNYAKLFMNNNTKIVHEIVNDRWEVAVYKNDDSFKNISFVNGIFTKNGTHVKHVTDKIIKTISNHIINKKKIKNVKNQFIKDKLFVFIKCFIENPSFGSQSKEELKSKVKNFGSSCIFSDKFNKNLLKTGIVEDVIDFVLLKDKQNLKKTDGKMKKKLFGVPKLEDANWAGTRKSSQCRLILTEGDSAKAFAMAGLSIIGRDKYGVFPLKGKLLNVRKASADIIMKNTEINNIKQILGLKQGKEYKNLNEIRYGSILVLTDQDVDGYHIKGLVFNLIHNFWPSLLKLGFVVSMSTPIVKARNKNKEKLFYSIPDYEKWKKKVSNLKNWKIKYYKGLGTSTSKEAKEYFKKFEESIVHYQENSNTDDLINLAFQKDNNKDTTNWADKRKEWLGSFNENNYLDYTKKNITYNDFINKELIHFSMADNKRSIPSLIDGLKPSQRKVLYCAIKKKLKNEIKVSQFSGYISEHSSYHHGEASLMSTIINLAQNYPGSNNINVLSPEGQFGTRYGKGKDHASARYIFTKLSEITNSIFMEDDNVLLNYLDDEGFTIEPEYYVPVIPMVLINGTEGIGTGYSTYIPPHKLEDIVNYLKLKLENKQTNEIKPYYRGFNGTFEKDSNKFIIKGKWKLLDEMDCLIEVSEIPANIGIEKYKEFLESIIIDKTKSNKKAILESYENHSSENIPKFILKLNEDKFTDLITTTNTNIMKKLKLISSISINNMHLYNKNNEIKKYKDVYEILDEFYEYRIQFYQKRKENNINIIENQLVKINNKYKFVKMVIDGEIKIFRQSKKFIEEQLIKNEFVKIDNNFDYLIKMPIINFSLELLEELKNKKETKEKELDILLNITVKEMWCHDLDKILKINKKYNKDLIAEFENIYKNDFKPKKKAKRKRKTKTKTKTKTKK